MISHFASQMELFPEENLRYENIATGKMGDYVILLETVTDMPSDEAEKKGLISIYKVFINITDRLVEERVDQMNYDLPAGSIIYYSWTDLWRLRYLMPDSYNQIISSQYAMH